MNRTALWLSLLLLLGSSVSVSQTQAPSQTPSQTYVELILDASGSMWNTLADGRYRIVAAKDVLTQFVGSLPDDNLNVGLRIYGSQMSALDDGACDDTQLFVPLAGLDKSALTQAVQDANAQGATPIAKSLLAAADDFPAQAEKRLIVLVTDGEESCDGDLQAVAADLQARGLDIDIRIIGFDLTAEAAASFAGVGTFENAENAQQLASALESAVEEVVTEVPVVETACEAVASLNVAGSVEASYPFSISFEGPEGRISVHPVGGDDFSALGSAFTGSGNPVELTAPGEAGSYELRYTANNGNCVVTTRQLEVTAITATLTVPAQVEGGFEFAVTADGPAGRVAIFEPSDINYRNYDLYSFFVTSWNNTMLRAPSQVGSYDIRYYDQNGTLLTTTVLEVIAADVSLTTPEQIEAGYNFPIEFRGPEGRIAIFEPSDTNYRNYDDYSFYVTTWNNQELTAPTQAGSYEVRYYDKNETLITSNTLEVIATTAGLTIPDSVEAGYAFSLDFSGPEGRIAIFEPSDTNYRNYDDYSFYVTTWNNQELTAPTQAGNYEVRYYDDNEGLLVSRSLEVRPTTATITAPDSIEAGYAFSLDFSGPEGRIAIFESGDTDYRNYDDYSFYVTTWNDKELTAPTQAGSYEIRYFDENSGLLTSIPLTVTPTTATLNLPSEVTAGAAFSFSFSGPDGRIAIFEVDDANHRNYNTYSFYVTSWNDISLTAPEQAGTYAVRYFDGNEGLLVSQTITVR